MRVLISGGGIAGLTLACWLQRYGMTPVVVEQAPGLRRDGYGIDFFGTGYAVAERMGVIDRLQAQQLPLDAIMVSSQKSGVWKESTWGMVPERDLQKKADSGARAAGDESWY